MVSVDIMFTPNKLPTQNYSVVIRLPLTNSQHFKLKLEELQYSQCGYVTFTPKQTPNRLKLKHRTTVSRRYDLFTLETPTRPSVEQSRTTVSTAIMYLPLTKS